MKFLQGRFDIIDVTVDAKALVTLVRDLSQNRGRTTVLQIVDIYKGCDLKKIRDAGMSYANSDEIKKYCKTLNSKNNFIKKLIFKRSR